MIVTVYTAGSAAGFAAGVGADAVAVRVPDGSELLACALGAWGQTLLFVPADDLVASGWTAAMVLAAARSGADPRFLVVGVAACNDREHPAGRRPAPPRAAAPPPTAVELHEREDRARALRLLAEGMDVRQIAEACRRTEPWVHRVLARQ